MTITTNTRTSANISPPPAEDPAELLPPPAIRKLLRRSQGLTQEQAAAEFGVTDGSMSNWENNRPGPRNMRPYLLRLLQWADEARAMGFSITWPAPAPAEPQK
ncbi:hypothetical protein AMIS_20450 [Actinoplanes missouriensis 431]|uniref:HTH cro/C1-type domain-containing protein n=1 Tax=Actinoplanes missouriensis (strain ATCC 14538 / DSM 43046 / CBS 188.64 / JCM 3121 / NBRC 102363 / NCIMB 12654 / NRRL B-3342 / UNCC 431) TaxID=512565 RepID=I0H2M8_ACTM4|nr:helix-turn-helix transcriptional regulator [Actinoplanes missouriensis]BAL87265.1 hypothetical protein AMIS_20450 [Actinoplanes missouriensis 431]